MAFEKGRETIATVKCQLACDTREQEDGQPHGPQRRQHLVGLGLPSVRYCDYRCLRPLDSCRPLPGKDPDDERDRQQDPCPPQRAPPQYVGAHEAGDKTGREQHHGPQYQDGHGSVPDPFLNAAATWRRFAHVEPPRGEPSTGPLEVAIDGNGAMPA